MEKVYYINCVNNCHIICVQGNTEQIWRGEGVPGPQTEVRPHAGHHRAHGAGAGGGGLHCGGARGADGLVQNMQR